MADLISDIRSNIQRCVCDASDIYTPRRSRLATDDVINGLMPNVQNQRRAAFNKWMEKNGLNPNRIAADIRSKTGNDVRPSTIYSVADMSRPRDPLSETQQMIADCYQVTVDDIFVSPKRLPDAIGLDERDHILGPDEKRTVNPAENAVMSHPEGANYLSEPRAVPMVGEVRAGAFMPVTSFDLTGAHSMIPYDVQRFRGYSVRALKVVGDSANLMFPDGTTVFVVPVHEVGGFRHKQFVVVRRHNGDGLAETTLKQLMIIGDRIELWPRSDDPQYQEPIVVPARDELSQDGLEIEFVVIDKLEPISLGEGPVLRG